MLPFLRLHYQVIDKCLRLHSQDTIRAYATYSREDVDSKLKYQVKRKDYGSSETRLSKTISYLLRHGAENEGLPIRKDGYVSVQNLLNHPKLRCIDVITLERIVKNDGKQRFHMLYDPHAQPGSPPQINPWWIRANQGHSLPKVELRLKTINDGDEIQVAVHGTTLHAWKSISNQGISRMGRNHIHLAQVAAGANGIGGMRSSSQIWIFIDLQKALKAGIPFYLSRNGVVLTPGNDMGILEPQFFQKVEEIRIQKTLLPCPTEESGTELGMQVSVEAGPEPNRISSRADNYNQINDS